MSGTGTKVAKGAGLQRNHGGRKDATRRAQDGRENVGGYFNRDRCVGQQFKTVQLYSLESLSGGNKRAAKHKYTQILKNIDQVGRWEGGSNIHTDGEKRLEWSSGELRDFDGELLRLASQLPLLHQTRCALRKKN